MSSSELSETNKHRKNMKSNFIQDVTALEAFQVNKVVQQLTQVVTDTLSELQKVYETEKGNA